MNLSINNFSCYDMCSSFLHNKYYTSCNSFSYTFKSGVYVLTGEIDCGAFAFCHSISDAADKPRTLGADTHIYIDNTLANDELLDKNICYLNKRKHIESDIYKELTFKSYLERRLYETDLPYSTYDYFERFQVPSEYINRQICQLGSMYMLVFYAIDGLLSKKSIFTMAWIGRSLKIGNTINNLFHGLQYDDSICIIPSSRFAGLPDVAIKLEMASLFDDPNVRLEYME